MARAPASDEAPQSSKRGEVERLYPLLTYHYGIAPSELVVLPRNLKEMYIDALPGIIAGEQLRAIEASSYPHMEEGDQKSTSRRWRDMLPGDAQPESYAPRSMEELQMFAAASGIAVVVEDAPKPPESAGETE